MRILIADDDDRRRAVLIDHLLHSGIATVDEIEDVDCVDNAKARLKAVFFDAFILDVVLPKRSGETPSPAHGLALLGQLTRSRTLTRPDRVIGITAHLYDIESFRVEFSKFCMVVIQANNTEIGWRSKVSDSLSYTQASRMDRAVQAADFQVVTVHGIRTFGGWQDRLRSLTHLYVGNFDFHAYKYGYFPALSFVFPFMRAIEIRRLTKHLQSLFSKNPQSKFVIFSHSCGTFLVAEALREALIN